MDLKNFINRIKGRIYQNKPILYILLAIALFIVNLLISLFFVLFKIPQFGSKFFKLSYSGGWWLLLVLGVWTLIFFYKKKTIEANQNNPPIVNCPACKEILDKKVNITNSTILLPKADAVYVCKNCNTKIESNFPFQKWYFDEIGEGNNPDIKWLYSQEYISKTELIGISKGKHTEEAIRKLKGRSLSRISRGDFNELLNIEIEWLSPSSHNKYYFSGFPSDCFFLDQQADRLLLIVRNVNMGRISTKDNKPYIKIFDSGTFYMTKGKFGLLGTNKSYHYKYSQIDNFKTGNEMIETWISGRKNPDYYLKLDERLIQSIFEGIYNENP